jgi:hypothetical protein
VSWDPGDFLVARASDPSNVAGYVYRGLGIYQARKASPKGRQPPEWLLVHLGSGHALCRIKGIVQTAFPIATEIAESGDWEFESRVGWKDRFPDAREKLAAIMARFPKQTDRNGPANSDNSEAVAREIAMARAT